MEKVRLFTNPHKGLRRLMGQFSLLAGSANYADPAQLEKLKSMGEDLFRLLDGHAHTENEIMLKLLEEKCPGAAEHDRQEHEQIEMMQQELQEALMALTTATNPEQAHAFYLLFSRFQAFYLGHMLEEETQTEELFQRHFTHEELLGIHGRIIVSFTPEQLMFSLRIIVPAQTEAERLAVLGGMKAKAPAPAFDAVMQMLSEEMNQSDFHSLAEKLSWKPVTIPA